LKITSEFFIKTLKTSHASVKNAFLSETVDLVFAIITTKIIMDAESWKNLLLGF